MKQNLENSADSETEKSEKYYVITSDSSTTAAVETESNDISPKEQKYLAGLSEPFDDATEESLISKEYQYSQSQPEKRDISDSPISRTVLVLMLVGTVVLTLLFIFAGFSGDDKQQRTQEQAEPESSTFVEDESDTYRAQLALIDQKRDYKQANETDPSRAAVLVQQSDSASSSEKEPSLDAAPSAPRHKERSETQPQPRQRTQTYTPTRQSLDSKPSRRTQKTALAPEIDPQQRWNLLATAGTQKIGDFSKSTDGDNKLQTQESLEEPQELLDISSPQKSQQSPQQSQQIPQQLDRQASSANGQISRVVIGGQEKPSSDDDSIGLTIGARGIVNRQSIKQDSYQPRSNSNIVSSASTNFLEGGNGSSTLTEGAKGIISRQKLQYTSTFQSGTQKSYTVPIGSSAGATVSVPIVWALDSSSPTAGRFAVILSEPLIAENGEIALPKDTVLITEVTEITPESHLVDQSAVAVVYRDRAHRVQQQEIPANALLIRGTNNQPLIAKSLSSSSGTNRERDLLVGALSSLSRIGEIINRPESEIIRYDDGFDSYRQERRTTADEPDLLAAALDGFFTTTAERLNSRSAQSVQEQLTRQNLLIVPEGEKVTVYVNAFLEVKR